ncbi:MAG: benzoate/H(+) symporter BenE family transporter, partial [Pseudobdellovibrio sp.]
STPGAVLLISGASGVSKAEAVGVFLFSATLIFISGASGFFEKIMNKIPLSLASGLLAGVLLNFCLSAFTVFNDQPLLLSTMILTYIICKKFFPTLAMLFVLIVGMLVAALLGQLHFEDVRLLTTEFSFTQPVFTWTSLIGLGLPLFIVTTASQNVTGITIMRSYGYENPVSRILGWTGLINMITAFFGGFTVNLAAITAAIAMSPEAHPDKNKRYIAGIFSGTIYVFIGLVSGTVTSLFSAFPKELVTAIAGLALLGTVAANLNKVFHLDHEKEAAFITFIVAASGFKFLNIGSAFWALVIGLGVQIIFNYRIRDHRRVN